jgi:hypothetical protein
MDLQDLSIGVLGDTPQQRSAKDQEMQSTFGQGTMELYQRPDFEARLPSHNNKPVNNGYQNKEKYCGSCQYN